MNWLNLVLCALATFRLAELLVIDEGPFDVFVNLRGWLNMAPFESNGPRRMFANLLSCVHCAGFWIAFVFAFFFTQSLLDFIIFFLAVAGLQSIISNKLGRKA